MAVYLQGVEQVYVLPMVTGAAAVVCAAAIALSVPTRRLWRIDIASELRET
jgi:hypothetical protein